MLGVRLFSGSTVAELLILQSRMAEKVKQVCPWFYIINRMAGEKYNVCEEAIGNGADSPDLGSLGLGTRSLSNSTSADTSLEDTPIDAFQDETQEEDSFNSRILPVTALDAPKVSSLCTEYSHS